MEASPIRTYPAPGEPRGNRDITAVLDFVEQRGLAQMRQACHFAMLDNDRDTGNTAGRYVLVVRDNLGDGYVTSWDVWEDVLGAAFPLEPGIVLIDSKTGVYWTHEGIFA